MAFTTCRSKRARASRANCCRPRCSRYRAARSCFHADIRDVSSGLRRCRIGDSSLLCSAGRPPTDCPGLYPSCRVSATSDHVDNGRALCFQGPSALRRPRRIGDASLPRIAGLVSEPHRESATSDHVDMGTASSAADPGLCLGVHAANMRS